MAYIDPGTGSMLFAIIVGIAGAVSYVIKSTIVKIKFLLSGGKATANAEVIPFVIFAESKRYWNIMEPICREFNRRGIDVVYLTASEDDPAFDCGLEHVHAEFSGTGNKTFARLNFLKADVVLATTPGLDVYQWKRSRDVKYYVHTLHSIGEVCTYRMFGLDYYDAVLCSGEFQQDDIRYLENLRNLPAKELPIVGVAYMDDLSARIAQTPRPHNTTPTVLLAPSWGKAAILSRYGGRILDALLQTSCHVIVRPHPQSFESEKDLMTHLMSAYPETDQLEWNQDRDNFDCLNRADIMISDFSGVVFEFALGFDKPIIYTDPNFDNSVYDAWWLDHEIWTLRALPKVGMQLSDDAFPRLGDMINLCLNDKRFAAGRAEVRQECWQCCGDGARNTVDYLVQKQTEVATLAPAEPSPKKSKRVTRKPEKKSAHCAHATTQKEAN